MKVPNYLAYTKTPDNYVRDPYVWEGNKAPSTSPAVQKQNAFRVTDDGYLEYFTGINIYTDGDAKPADYAKLQKFVKKKAIHPTFTRNQQYSAYQWPKSATLVNTSIS